LSDISLSLINRSFAGQIKEAVLSGVALEDDKRENFNKIEQVCFNE
jgi:hypothetical protein